MGVARIAGTVPGVQGDLAFEAGPAYWGIGQTVPTDADCEPNGTII
jgi:hypothetical protein